MAPLSIDIHIIENKTIRNLADEADSQGIIRFNGWPWRESDNGDLIPAEGTMTTDANGFLDSAKEFNKFIDLLMEAFNKGSLAYDEVRHYISYIGSNISDFLDKKQDEKSESNDTDEMKSVAIKAYECQYELDKSQESWTTNSRAVRKIRTHLGV